MKTTLNEIEIQFLFWSLIHCLPQHHLSLIHISKSPLPQTHAGYQEQKGKGHRAEKGFVWDPAQKERAVTRQIWHSWQQTKAKAAVKLIPGKSAPYLIELTLLFQFLFGEGRRNGQDAQKYHILNLLKHRHKSNHVHNGSCVTVFRQLTTSSWQLKVNYGFTVFYNIGYKAITRIRDLHFFFI